MEGRVRRSNESKSNKLLLKFISRNKKSEYGIKGKKLENGTDFRRYPSGQA